MKISLQWLSDYLELPKNLTPAQIQEKITTSIAEVENVQAIGQDGILVAKVLSVSKHPQADRLKVVAVATGKKEYTVVCGGTNLREGMWVAYASVGSKIKWHGEGDYVPLEKATIRGVASEGMICASDEIELPIPCGDTEIADLTPYVGTKDLGRNVYNVLDLRDTVLEVDNKSLTNRPDLFGHYGLARDLSAVLHSQNKINVHLQPYPQKKLKFEKDKLDIIVRTDYCRRFCAVKVSNVRIQESPLWIKKRLERVGVRPINNVVDLTNYIMYDLGHPMHAFDARELMGKKTTVDLAKPGQKLLALDGKEYQLSTGDMVIYADGKPTSLAGIMGGEGSGVHDDTTEVIFESASWDPASIRKTSQRLGLRSEASTRYEKNLDPELPPQAINRTVALLLELCPGARITSALFDQYRVKIKNKPIALRPGRVATKVGVIIPVSAIKTILKDLGCIVTSGKKALQVTVPSWRGTKDLKIEDDLIEEVARVYGYHLIPVTAPAGVLRPHRQPEKQLERKLKNVLVHELGFFEVLHYPFTNLKEQAQYGLPTSHLGGMKNPISAEQTHLKTSLLPNLLETAKKNIHHTPAFALFELGRVYNQKGSGFVEQKKLGGILIQEKTKQVATYENVFFNLKQRLEVLFEGLRLPPRNYALSDIGLKPFSQGQAAVITIGDTELGYVSNIAAEQKSVWDLEHHEVAVFELDVNFLGQLAQRETTYQPLPKYPAVLRDFAFVIQKSVPAVTVTKTIEEAHPQVERAELFDVYESDSLGTGKKSLAYQVTYVNVEKTFTEQEIEHINRTIVEHVGHLGGQLRT